MKPILDFFSSSIGKKLLVGLSAFFLMGFLSFHLYANLHLYAGQDAFNATADLIERQLIIPAMSIGLMAIILFHAFITIALYLRNRLAKGPSPRKDALGENRRAPMMALSGTLILVFLVLHIMKFKYTVGLQVGTVHGMRDLYSVATFAFASKIYSGFYILSTLVLGMHLWHGTASFFRTFGLYTPRYAPLIKALGVLVAVVFGLGFMSFPIWFGFIAPCGPCAMCHP